MPNLRDIQRRINSVTSTRQITHTMEMVSTTKIMKALKRADDAGPYKEAMQRMLQNVASQASAQQVPFLAKRTECKRAVLIVIASDRGLAGGFNVQVERAAMKRARQLEATGATVDFICAGKKVVEFLHVQHKEPVLRVHGVSQDPTVAQANQLASYVLEGYAAHDIDLVELWYQHAKSRVEQVLTREQLLPVTTDALSLPNAPRENEQIKLATPVPTGDFDFSPSPEYVLQKLIPSYVRTVIYHALIDSAAAEHGARRLAMQAATKNADDIITRLSREYNRIRQSSITTELSEIVGGAEALQQQEA